MARRFEYDRMTAERIKECFKRLGIDNLSFSRLTGVNRATVQKWENGEQDISPIAALVLETWMQNPSQLIIARNYAAKYIRFDNDYPERGEYPFLNNNLDDQD